MDFGFWLQSHSATINKNKFQIEIAEQNQNEQSLTKATLLILVSLRKLNF